MVFLTNPRRLAALSRTRGRRGIPFIDPGPPIAAQDGGDGGVRPAGMLPHGRGDGDTFSSHQGHWVNGDMERIRHGGIEHLEREMRSVGDTVELGEQTAGLSVGCYLPLWC